MDFTRTEAVPLQAFVQLAHRGLAVAEDDGGLHIFAADQVTQNFALFHRRNFDQLLFDIDVGSRWTRHLDIFRVRQELVRKLFDRRRHRCRKQQRLAVGRQFGADMFDVGNETHVEHAIGFVDHQQFASVQQYVAAFEQIHQSARCRDQHVDAFFQRLYLITH